MKFARWMVCSIFFATAAFADDAFVRFYNKSSNPILVAGAHEKNASIAGIGSSGYDDPSPFINVRGYYRIDPQKYFDIPKELEVDHLGQKMKGRLLAIRVIVRSPNGEQAIVHPNQTAKPMYLPVHKDNGATGWELRIATIFPTNEEAIDRIIRDGAPATPGMFYSVSEYGRTDSAGNQYYGVGGGGSESARIIGEFWQTHAEFTGTTFRILNSTGEKRDFTLAFFNGATQNWTNFSDWKTAATNDRTQWTAKAQDYGLRNADGTWKIRIESRNFNGVKTYWENVRVSERPVQENGKRHLFVDIELR